MAFIVFYNCIIAAVVACFFFSLLNGAKPKRAAGVLGVLCGLNKRFKAVLRAFSPLVVNCSATTQKRKNGACRHVKRLYTAPHSIQAKQKTATAAGLLSGLYNIVSRTTKHSLDNYLWLKLSNPTIYCGTKNREKLRCVCHFWDFQYITGLTGEVFIYGKNFFKKYPKKISDVCVKNLKTRINFITTGEVFK